MTAAIVKNGRIVCAAAAGMANAEAGIPAAPDTLFLVASISKTITATALMQLHEQGAFTLDDDINDYLPFSVRIPAAPRAPITFRQLLTHTASIVDNDDYISVYSLTSFVTRGADSTIPLADFTKGYLTPGGAYYDWWRNFKWSAPGTVNDYSNMGIVLAGYLVEVISGLPFDEYCKRHIFEPLGMTNSSWRLADIDQANLAMPYAKRFWWFGFVPYGQYGEPDYPDGMLRTSAVELAQFLIAYMQGGSYGAGRLLEPATVRAMLAPQTPLDPTQGLVWYQDTIGGRKVWGHDGSSDGASAEMWFDPKTGEGVILMGNSVWEDARSLLAALFEEAGRY